MDESRRPGPGGHSPKQEATEECRTTDTSPSGTHSGDSEGRRAAVRNGIRRRLARLAILVTVLVLVLVAGGLVAGWLYGRSIDQRIERLDVFGPLPQEGRPAKSADGPLNFLVLGRDAADPGENSSRTDTIILVHVPADRERVQAISIPRDTWVTIPETADGRPATQAKINAAYAWGGAPLMVSTVERFTGVRIDHVVVVDFAGFAQIVDALGGVQVTVDRTFVASEPPHRAFVQGVRHLDGASALDYARERHAFPDGDFARMRHQQDLIAAMVDQAARGELLTNPRRLDQFLRAAAQAVSVDENLSLFELGWTLRRLTSARISMFTSPSAGTGMVGDQSVVFADTAAAGRLFEAVRTDRMDGWIAENTTP
ncbi:LCP family protein [Plantactinospora sp. DSM 117369]